MCSELENGVLVLYPEGRIDSVNADEVEMQILDEIGSNPGVPYIIDAGRLEYISSAGLRVILKLIGLGYRPAEIRNASPLVYDMMEASGFISFLTVRKRMREISVVGLPLVGSGAVGTVYRLDVDSIVKVFNKGVGLDVVEREQKKARQAFLKGIPTAIAFDIVRVGDRYGAVFEMIKADSFNDVVVREPERTDEIIGAYVRLMKQIHRVSMNPVELPDSRQVYLQYLNEIGAIPEKLSENLRSILTAMPENLHVVHGDLQMKNIMMSDGDPMLIDMDTLSVGDPAFEFAGLFVAYIAFSDFEPDNTVTFFGIDAERCAGIYRSVLEAYLGEANEAAVRHFSRRSMLLGYIRYLYLLTVLKLGKEELRAVRVENALKKLEALAGEC